MLLVSAVPSAGSYKPILKVHGSHALKLWLWRWICLYNYKVSLGHAFLHYLTPWSSAPSWNTTLRILRPLQAAIHNFPVDLQSLKLLIQGFVEQLGHNHLHQLHKAGLCQPVGRGGFPWGSPAPGLAACPYHCSVAQTAERQLQSCKVLLTPWGPEIIAMSACMTQSCVQTLRP